MCSGAKRDANPTSSAFLAMRTRTSGRAARPAPMEQRCESKEAPCYLSVVGFIPALTHTGRATFIAPSVPTRFPYGIFARTTFEERYDSILLSVPHSLCPDI